MIDRQLYRTGPDLYGDSHDDSREPHAAPSLEFLPVHDRAFFRVLYGLDLAWPDLEYLAGLTGRPADSLVQQLRDIYSRNLRRRTDAESLMDKITGAYSRLTELTREEHLLEENLYALSLTHPVDPQRHEKILFDLERLRNRIAQLRRQQTKWRTESAEVLRLPSKEVSLVFNISPAAVDQRAVRIGRRVRALSSQ